MFLSPEIEMESSGDVHAVECLVCGDKSTGRHYGAVSCEGCKSFFKRCVRNRSSFVCKDGGSCEINQVKRTKCQSCRLARCLTVGMKHEAVQMGRTYKNSMGGPQLKIFTRLLEFEHLLNFEPNDPNPTLQSPHSRQLHALHILRSVVQWSEKVTSMVGLSPYDSKVLIGQTWHHVYAVALIRSDLPSILKESPSHGSLFIFFERLKSLCSSGYEMVYLRALLLLNPDVPLLTNPVQVETIQNKLLRLVDEFQVNHSGVPLSCRIGKLLLVLLGTSACAPETLERIFFPHFTQHSSILSYIRNMIN